MKRVAFALFAFVALLALPVNGAASSANQETTPATSPQVQNQVQDQVQNQVQTQVQEERTNPAMGTTAPGSGLTLTGTVVSSTDETLVVQTSTGSEHFVLQPDTQRPSTFTVGEQVSVDYVRSSQNGVMIARVVRPGGETSTTTRVEAAADEVDAELSRSDDIDNADDFDNADDTRNSALPTTGGKGPIAALLGLLALGVAAVLRRL